VTLTREDYLQSIWAALRRIEDNLALPPAPLELPAPQVTVLPAQIDLTDVVEAVNQLKPGVNADDIARALAAVLAPQQVPVEVAGMADFNAAVKELSWRLKGVGAQAYGGGAVTLAPNTTFPVTGTVAVSNFPSAYQTNQAGTWAYYAGVSGTVNISAGQRILGIAAHATTAGSMTINGGASVPIPANSAIQFSPVGTLVAPVLVFTGTDSYTCEVVSG
jgi:hypothetical protein